MNFRRRASRALLCLVLCWTVHVHVRAQDQASGPEAVRQGFMDALAAVQALPTAPAAGDAEALRGYVLYPYLQAARLQRQLELAKPASQALGNSLLPLDDEVAAFLARHGEAPVTRKVRSAWLTSLADRKAWSTFLEQFDARRDGDAGTLQCHAFAARLALDRTAGLVEDLTRVWLTGKALPSACDGALEWWKGRGGPGDDLVERRARLALEAGDATLARHLTRSLPVERAAPLLQWVALIEQPAREIPALIAAPERIVEPAALEDGWMRFARADAALGAVTFPSLVTSRKLDARAASPYALSVALACAWSRLPCALEFFAQVQPGDYDERAHEWHARAALWAGDWARVAVAIAAMPDALRTQPRWQYWAARASERNGEFAQARAGYAAVIPTDNWYAALASARLDRKVTPTLQPLVLAAAELDRLEKEPAFTRIRELVACRLDDDASQEWRVAVDALPPARQSLAVGLASRWGWHPQAIASAARQRIFNDYELLYPRPFDFDVRAASQRTGLSREFIYAIIRQESLYRADAGSTAGALGLMQLLPATARLTARRVGLQAPTRAQLLEPATNIALGSAYLAGLVDRFDGETALATAAYNAGPNAARRWLPAEPLELDVWAENIPFNETRAYVQRVAWHAIVFDWLEKREPRDVTALLRSVKPLALKAASAE